MELIFYDKAAQIIGCTEGSLRHAVSRGELTRAARKGRFLCLIREQVELFKGRRISYNSLSPEDKALWRKYADQVNTIESQSQSSQARDVAVLDQDTLMQVVKQALLEQQAEQAEKEAEEARQRAIKAREQSEKERFHEGHPFLLRVKARDLVRA